MGGSIVLMNARRIIAKKLLKIKAIKKPCWKARLHRISNLML